MAYNSRSRRHKGPSRADKREQRRINDIRTRKSSRFSDLTNRREEQDEIAAFLAQRQAGQETAAKLRSLGR